MVYEQSTVKLNQYERNMNKKISEVRMKFINEIENKKSSKGEEIARKMLIKEK